MSRDSVILRILIAILGAAIISMIAYEIAQCQFSASEVTEPENLCVGLDKKVLKSSDTLKVFLQDLGESLDSVTKKDLKWLLFCYSTEFDHKIYSPNKRITEWKTEEVVQVELKRGKDSPRDEITPTFKKSFSVEFLEWFSFFSEVIE